MFKMIVQYKAEIAVTVLPEQKLIIVSLKRNMPVSQVLELVAFILNLNLEIEQINGGTDANDILWKAVKEEDQKEH